MPHNPLFIIHCHSATANFAHRHPRTRKPPAPGHQLVLPEGEEPLRATTCPLCDARLAPTLGTPAHDWRFTCGSTRASLEMGEHISGPRALAIYRQRLAREGLSDAAL